jgi:Methyltransferase FkbM domain
MNIKQTLKKFPKLYMALVTALHKSGFFDRRFNRVYPRYKPTPRWQERIKRVKQSADNSRIQTVDQAGQLFPHHQLMHNGLQIALGSYYDYGNTRLLEENHGIHEPQEEFVFQEVIKEMPENACMMELGSYWAFYSMWFASRVKGSRCFMIEPDPHKMSFGKINFGLNHLTGTFDMGFIDEVDNLHSRVPSYSVDYLIKKHNIGFLNILHSDIQGYEYKMLLGAENALRSGMIDYIFISTHSNELHAQCQEHLLAKRYEILCSYNLNESYSWDGVLVAKHRRS